MTKITTTGLLLVLPAFVIAATVAQADKDDARAREAVEQFIKAALARDLDGVMKHVDVPWCQDARRIVKDKEELRKAFLKSFQRPGQLMEAKLHIREVGTLEQLREKKKGPPARDVSLGEVLGKEHRVVFVELEHDGRLQPVWIGVRLEKGEAKVVGTVD
jgi:hypothetical protein